MLNKLFYFLVLVFIGIMDVSCHSKKQNAKEINQSKITFTVSGKITKTSTYCGGAAPSPEILKSYRTPQPYVGKELFIKKGDTNNLKEPILIKIAADSEGKFQFDLPDGNYVLLQKEQTEKLNYSKFDFGKYYHLNKGCLDNWWLKPLMKIKIEGKNISGLDFNFHRRCFQQTDVPCITYNGPMPP
ncbi:MAG: hypothetical protein AB7O73_05275 [Bacteroidia bacterium]